MTARPRICVVGSLNMDLVVRTPHLPVPGETVLGGPFDTFPGGKGANQAVAAARAGADVALVGAVGADGFGDALRATLDAAGIAGVTVRSGVATGVALITVDAHGENTIVVASGANATVDRELVDARADAIRGADALVCQLEVPLAAVRHACGIAHAAGVRVILNAAPATPLPADLLGLVDVLVVNRIEAARVAGPTAAPGVEVLARELASRGPRLVAITLGADGALACGAAGAHRQPGFAVDAVDTVGAGDAFVGALAVATASGLATADALRFACAAGALATTRHGAQPSLPDRNAIRDFLAQRGAG